MTGAPLEPPALEEGSTFAGRFRIERRRAGEDGARWTAWEAVGVGEDAPAERCVLILWPAAAVTAEAVRTRFVEAIARAASIDDASVVRVLAGGIDETSGAPWLAKEDFRGEPLPELVAAQDRLERATARTVLAAVASALGAAHARGVFVRELFAADVTVRREPSADLVVKLDLGAALAVAALGERSVARTAPRWSAPEVDANGSAPADVWCFGMLARRVLVGAADSPASAEDEVPASANVPAGFGLWLSGAVAREASLRFLTMSDAWSALERVLDGRGEPTVVAAPGATRPPPAPSRTSWVLAAVIFGSMAFVIVVAGFVFGDPPPVEASQPLRGVALPPRASASVSASALAYDPLPPLVASTAAAPSAPPAPAPDPVDALVDACVEQGDIPCVRRSLEAPVFAASATPAQAQMLYDLCEIDRDDACRAKVIARYATVDTARTRRMDLPFGQRAGHFGDRRGLAGSVAQRARMLLEKGDAMGARSLLAPRVFGKIATTEEVRLLVDVCDRLHDRSCHDDVAAMYPGLRL